MLHFINANLIDPEAGTVTRGTLRVEGGKITAIQPDTASIPGDSTIIDCGGKYLAPGIVDLASRSANPGSGTRKASALPDWRRRLGG